MRLFHITPERNLDDYSQFCIDPSCSQGAREISWFVDQHRVEWALAHCSIRHKVKVDELAIIEVMVVDLRDFNRTRWQGVYTTDQVNYALVVIPAVVWIDDNAAYPGTHEHERYER